MPPADPALALALLALDGVGRATAHRLLARFPTPEALAATPREQVLLRLRGAPRAESVVERLTDGETLPRALDRAREEVAALGARRIALLTPGHPHWPAGLDGLPRAARPVVLWAFGNAAALVAPTVALLARAPLPPEPYERAQALAQRLFRAGAVPVVGLRPGFDVALHRLAAGAGAPCVAVAPCGLARIEGAVRPSATAVVRAGGVLVSSFPMAHGPFPHDDAERAQVQAALARAVVAAAPREGTPEARALAWAAENGRPAFAAATDPGALAAAGAPPDEPPAALHAAVRPLASPEDLDAVLAALAP